MARTLEKRFVWWVTTPLLVVFIIVMLVLLQGGAASADATPLVVKYTNCPDGFDILSQENENEIYGNTVKIDISSDKCLNSPVLRHLRTTIWKRINMTKHLKKLGALGITPSPTFQDIETWLARKKRNRRPEMKKKDPTWMEYALHEQAVVNWDKKYWNWKKEQELANRSDEVRGLRVNLAETRRVFKYLKIDDTERYRYGRIGNELAAVHLISDTAIKRRRAYLKKVLSRIDPQYHVKGVIVTSFNSPYRHLWDNFVCAADRFHVPFRERVLLIPVGQSDYRELLKKNDLPGLINPSMVVPEAFGELDEAGSATFGPAHKLILSVQFLIVADLIAMGVSTLFMDIDVFLRADPFPLIHELNNRWPKDLWGVYDHRDDDATPLNGGFVLFFPTCRTKLLLETMTRLTWLLLQMGSGQRWFNLILNSKYFREVEVGILPDHQFINGHQWHRHPTNAHGRKEKAMYLQTRTPEEMVMVHVSWTAPRIDKIYKLRSVGLWLLNATTGECWDQDAEVPVVPYVKVPEKYDENGKKNEAYYGRYTMRSMKQFINWTTLQKEDLG